MRHLHILIQIQLGCLRPFACLLRLSRSSHEFLRGWEEGLGICVPVVGLAHVCLSRRQFGPRLVKLSISHFYQLIHYRLEIFGRAEHERVETHATLEMASDPTCRGTKVFLPASATWSPTVP
jgi:hypothetical protein